ncbi:MAG: ribonuclease H-like domain-containing protein [Desulfoprunum sp.]|nr:ribonuclease H-like domain-containing protein [Desulfoprunum sp.]
MLEHTFCHIPGLGVKTERNLWQAGVRTWDDWQQPPPIPLRTGYPAEIPGILQASLKALADDPAFFASRLAASEQWRIFPHFRQKTAYIDIETTGLVIQSEITTIAVYDGTDIYHFINGRNLADFPEFIQQYQVLVSYNGKSFDVPFLERFFRIRLRQAHIDLRYILGRLGFRGGLKGCEKQLGMDRGYLEGVDGYFAVLLWHEYELCHDEQALETLLAYNIADTVNLERLAVEAYNRNIATLPFAAELTLDWPTPPSLPFQAHPDCIERIRRKYPQYRPFS